MLNIYEKYGYYAEDLTSITLAGADGANKIAEIIKAMRENSPKNIGGLEVIAVRDYEASERTEIVTGEKQAIELPKSNVLYFELENNGWCCVRPSGTEPKIKFYFGIKSDSIENAQTELEKVKTDMTATVQNV